MIEFKGDCGHTVRAKDEDAGKVVRCAYCGREAQVPEDERDDLDFLFSDGASTPEGSGSAKSPAKGRAASRSGMPFAKTGGSADPFNIVKKMAYVAAILICCIFIGKKYAWPLMEEAFFDQSPPQTSTPPRVVRRPAQKPSQSQPAQRKPDRYGFVARNLESLGPEGVYILPVPSNVKLYHCTNSPGKGDYDWLRDMDTDRPQANKDFSVKPGSHVFVAVLPVNSPYLKRYANIGYNDLRRGLEEGLKRARDVEAFFRPDAATEVAVLDWHPLRIARRYEVVIHAGEWRVIAPQFLPYALDLLEITKVLKGFSKSYSFDKNDVRSELEFYRVGDHNEQGYLMDILEKLGNFGYAYQTGQGGSGDMEFLNLSINAMDGVFSAVKLEGVRRPARGR